jgi:hypothetical protein
MYRDTLSLSLWRLDFVLDVNFHDWHKQGPFALTRELWPLVGDIFLSCYVFQNAHWQNSRSLPALPTALAGGLTSFTFTDPELVWKQKQTQGTRSDSLALAAICSRGHIGVFGVTPKGVPESACLCGTCMALCWVISLVQLVLLSQVRPCAKTQVRL